MAVENGCLGPVRSLRGQHVCALAALAILVFVAYFGVLFDGVFYDDHWHRANLRTCGWGWNDLIEATTFDFPGQLIHLWWQDQPLQWRYPRPVAMFFMKLEYTLTGGNPVGLHAAGLIWHWLTAFLVYRLALWVLVSPLWAFLAAVLFVLNPNAAFAVSWSAARNALVGTFFLVAAVLAYTAASFDRNPGAPGQPTAVRWPWLSAAIGLWLLALFSRETSIVFPALVLLLDLTFGGRRHAWRRVPVYLILLALISAYLYWRFWVFPTLSPPEVYFRTPQGMEYLVWSFSKFVQLVLTLTAYIPMIGQLEPSHPKFALFSVGMTALLLPGTIAYVWKTRGLRGRWFVALWMLLTLAPLVPVAPMPHFSYLPFAGWALAVVLFVRSFAGRQRVLVLVGTLCGIAGAFAGHRMIWRGAFRAEQLVYADIRATPRPPAGSTVFLINAPTWATFAAPALREAWGEPRLDVEVLTLAPECFRMRWPSTVEKVSDHEIVVSMASPGYFNSYLTRALLRMSRTGAPLTAGLTVPGELFDSTVLETVDSGVTRLQFKFHRPLTSPDFRFYLSTPERPAQPLRFDQPPDAAALARETAQFNAAHGAEIAERDRLFQIVDWLPAE